MPKFSTGQIVRKIRGRLSQQKFADRLGVSIGALRKWESNKARPCPENLDHLAQIAPPELAAHLGIRDTPGSPARTDLAKQVDALEARIRAVEEVLHLPEPRGRAETLAVEGRASPKRKSGTSPAGGVTNHLTGT